MSLPEYVCSVCERRQLTWDPALRPNGLQEDEAKIVGWSNERSPSGRTLWYCPFHTPEGVAKLRAVANKTKEKT